MRTQEIFGGAGGSRGVMVRFFSRVKPFMTTTVLMVTMLMGGVIVIALLVMGGASLGEMMCYLRKDYLSLHTIRIS